MSVDFKLNNQYNQFDRLDLDLCLDGKGGFQTVENRDKLGQDLQKVLLTEKATNMFHVDYGSEIRSHIGIVERREIIEPSLKNTTDFAILYYKELQADQIKTPQFVSMAEKIDSVKFINVKWAGSNPMLYLDEPNLPSEYASFTYFIEVGVITGESTQLILNLKP